MEQNLLLKKIVCTKVEERLKFVDCYSYVEDEYSNLNKSHNLRSFTRGQKDVHPIVPFLIQFLCGRRSRCKTRASQT